MYPIQQHAQRNGWPYSCRQVSWNPFCLPPLYAYIVGLRPSMYVKVTYWTIYSVFRSYFLEDVFFPKKCKGNLILRYFWKFYFYLITCFEGNNVKRWLIIIFFKKMQSAMVAHSKPTCYSYGLMHHPELDRSYSIETAGRPSHKV